MAYRLTGELKFPWLVTVRPKVVDWPCVMERLVAFALVVKPACTEGLMVSVTGMSLVGYPLAAARSVMLNVPVAVAPVV